MLRFAASDVQAKAKAKADFGYHCIITGMHKDDLADAGIELDPAHFFQASTYPAVRLCIENIFPINRRAHSDRRFDCFDYVREINTMNTVSRNRRADERMTWLITHCLAPYRQNVRERLETLLEGILAEIQDNELQILAKNLLGVLHG